MSLGAGNEFLISLFISIAIFSGVFIPVAIATSLLLFILYMISKEKFRPKYFLCAGLFVPLSFVVCQWLFLSFNHLVDVYCTTYILVVFFVVLRGIFCSKNINILDYLKVLIPFFIAYAYIFIKITEMNYAHELISALVNIKVNQRIERIMFLFPIPLVSYFALSLLTKLFFVMNEKKELYFKKKKLIISIHLFICLIIIYKIDSLF